MLLPQTLRTETEPQTNYEELHKGRTRRPRSSYRRRRCQSNAKERYSQHDQHRNNQHAS
jgi:hypothetical protein